MHKLIFSLAFVVVASSPASATFLSRNATVCADRPGVHCEQMRKGTLVDIIEEHGSIAVITKLGQRARYFVNVNVLDDSE